MSTPIASITRRARQARAGRRAWAVTGALVAAGALAAGCGTASVSSGTAGAAPGSATSGSATSGGTGAGSASAGSTGTAAGGTATSGPASGPTAPAAPASPVPTVSGGTVVPGEVACVGWPSGTPAGSLPASFVPVTVERCVLGAEPVSGKGLWSTATLERTDSDLATLISALRRPSVTHMSGACPALAEIPPAVVLISATGQKLIPKLPVTGCGLIQSQVTLALGALHWTTLSVRLISQISGDTSPATVSGSSRSLQTVAANP
jgi:hypothetical protein